MIASNVDGPLVVCAPEHRGAININTIRIKIVFIGFLRIAIEFEPRTLEST